ncbi:hypothetical protein JCM13580A_62960 [Streptomyces drozdowiczii]
MIKVAVVDLNGLQLALVAPVTKHPGQDMTPSQLLTTVATPGPHAVTCGPGTASPYVRGA